MHKSNTIGFFPREEVEDIRMASMQSETESYWTFLGNLEAAITKKDGFSGKFRKKSVSNWKKNDPEVVRNLYENYTNRPLAAKRAKSLMTRF